MIRAARALVLARKAGFCAAISLFGLATQAHAADFVEGCAPPGIFAERSLDELPKPLRDALGDIVPPGAPFDATDVVTVGHSARLLFAWNYDQRWIVAEEHGGRSYGLTVFEYELSADGAHADQKATRTVTRATACGIATDLALAP
jgi:hypothetical protein